MESVASTMRKKVVKPPAKKVKQIDFDCMLAAEKTMKILVKTEVFRGGDIYLWQYFTAKRERDQIDVAKMLAHCCVSRGYAPDTIIKDTNDRSEFPWHVSGHVSLLFTRGSGAGVGYVSIPPTRLINGYVTVDPDGEATINLMAHRRLLYVSYEMPTAAIMSAIERFAIENGAEKIYFGSVIGPKHLQSPSKFSLIHL